MGELREENVVPPLQYELVDLEGEQCFTDLGTHIIYKPNRYEYKVD